MSMKKILLIGCGYWGKNWYKTLRKSEYDLVAVVDPNPSIPIDVPLFDKLKDVNVNFTHVIIATPAQFHCEILEQLLHNGSGITVKNILVEKPCGLNSGDAYWIKNSYQGFIFLHDPLYQYIKNNITDLGDILSFHSVRASMGPRIRTDVSIIEDYLIHDLYIFGDLFGFEKINSLYKFEVNQFNDPIKTPNEITLNFRLDKMSVSMFSSWWWPQKERQIIIIGTKGSFIWKDDELLIKREYYKPISGTDDFGNQGYKLVQDPTETRLNNLLSKSNLELELDSFVSGKKPFSGNLTTEVWKFMESI